MKEAYITVLGNDPYLLGVCGLWRTLKRYTSKDLVVLVSSDVSLQAKERLRKLSDRIRLIDLPALVPSVDFSESKFSHWKYTFFKLNIWKCCEYDKLVF